MAKHKQTHHNKVAPKAPVEVTPPAVSPPGGGTVDQSGLKWYQKKIMGVPMWVFLGIAGAIAAYFLYEYIAGSSSAATSTVPSSASTDPTAGTTGDTTGGASGGGSGVVDPISGSTGVGNAGPTVTGGSTPSQSPTPTITATPNASQANNPAYAGINLGGSTLTNLYPGQAGSGPSPGSTSTVDNRVAPSQVQATPRQVQTLNARANPALLSVSDRRFGIISAPAPKPAPAPAKLPTEKAMVKVSKIKTAPKASAKKEAAGKAATISHAMTPR